MGGIGFCGVLDIITLILVILLCSISYRIYKSIPYSSLLWLILAYGIWAVVRGIVVVQDVFSVAMMSDDSIMALAGVFFLFQFFGMYALYKVIRKYMGENAARKNALILTEKVLKKTVGIAEVLPAPSSVFWKKLLAKFTKKSSVIK